MAALRGDGLGDPAPAPGVGASSLTAICSAVAVVVGHGTLWVRPAKHLAEVQEVEFLGDARRRGVAGVVECETRQAGSLAASTEYHVQGPLAYAKYELVVIAAHALDIPYG